MSLPELNILIFPLNSKFSDINNFPAKFGYPPNSFEISSFPEIFIPCEYANPNLKRLLIIMGL